MTIVIAQIRDQEILLQADTKVNDVNATRSDTIPGRLKIVTLGHRFTVAFAGDADPAHIALRDIGHFVAARKFQDAIDCLKGWSLRHDIDFIVAAHQESARLLRIRGGAALEISDICTIGDSKPFAECIETARHSKVSGPFKHNDLRVHFIDRLLTNRGLGDHIGGFPTAVEATPAGHIYLGCSGTYTFKFPKLKLGEATHQTIEEVYSGEGHLQLLVVAPPCSDVPVMGVCLVQARAGYLFSPLRHPSGQRINLFERKEWDGHESAMHDVLRCSIQQEVDFLLREHPGRFTAN